MTDDQRQELASHIAEKCTEMKLNEDQILEGITYSLIAALNTFEKKSLNLDVAGYSLSVSKDGKG